jgi:hypothetical protein
MVCIKTMGWAGLVARMGRKRNSYTIFGRKPEGRPRLRWRFVTRIYRRETTWNGID